MAAAQRLFLITFEKNLGYTNKLVYEITDYCVTKVQS